MPSRYGWSSRCGARRTSSTRASTAPESTVVYTRTAPAGSSRPPGHLDAGALAPLVAELAPAGAVAYVCGSTGFAEHASQLLVEVGMAADAVRVERFGPSA